MTNNNMDFNVLSVDQYQDLFRKEIPGLSVWYQPAFLRASEMIERGRLCILYARHSDGAAIYPAFLRPISKNSGFGASANDLITPFEYGGPIVLAAPSRKDTIASLFLIEIARWATESDVIGEAIALPPFIHVPNTIASAYHMVESTPAVVVNAAPRVSQGPRRYRRSVYGKLRKAVRSDIGPCAWDGNPGDLADFVRIYHENMLRIGAKKYYLFPEKYFSALVQAEPPCAKLLLAKDGSGSVVGGILLLFDGLWGYSHLVGVAGGSVQHGTAVLLYDAAVSWTTMAGLEMLYLGGGRQSLVEFKRNFSSDTIPVRIGYTSRAEPHSRSEACWEGAVVPSYRGAEDGERAIVNVARLEGRL